MHGMENGRRAHEVWPRGRYAYLEARTTRGAAAVRGWGTRPEKASLSARWLVIKSRKDWGRAPQGIQRWWARSSPPLHLFARLGRLREGCVRCRGGRRLRRADWSGGERAPAAHACAAPGLRRRRGRCQQLFADAAGGRRHRRRESAAGLRRNEACWQLCRVRRRARARQSCLTGVEAASAPAGRLGGRSGALGRAGTNSSGFWEQHADQPSPAMDRATGAPSASPQGPPRC